MLNLHFPPQQSNPTLVLVFPSIGIEPKSPTSKLAYSRVSLIMFWGLNFNLKTINEKS